MTGGLERRTGAEVTPAAMSAAKAARGRRLTVRTLPRGGRINDDTEFVFVGGQAFVNAAKHQEVVDHHCRRFEGHIAEVIAFIEDARWHLGLSVPNSLGRRADELVAALRGDGPQAPERAVSEPVNSSPSSSSGGGQ